MKLVIFFGAATFFSVAASLVMDPKKLNRSEDVVTNDEIDVTGSEAIRIEKEIVEGYKKNITEATENLRLFTKNIVLQAKTKSLQAKCTKYFDGYDKKAQEIVSDFDEYINFISVAPVPEVHDEKKSIINELILFKVAQAKMNHFSNELTDVFYQIIDCVRGVSYDP